MPFDDSPTPDDSPTFDDFPTLRLHDSLTLRLRDSLTPRLQSQHPPRDHLQMPHERGRIGFGNIDVPQDSDSCTHRCSSAKHQQGRNDGEVCERRMYRLKQLLSPALGDDAAHGREDAGDECQFVRPEMRPTVGDLAQHDRQKQRGLVDRLDDGFDQPVEFPIGRHILGHHRTQAFGDRGEDVADDAGVEGTLVGKVVVDHRLVHARTPGDAVDGGGGEAVGTELVGGGGKDAVPGTGVGGSRSGHKLTNRLVNTSAALLSSRPQNSEMRRRSAERGGGPILVRCTSSLPAVQGFSVRH